MEDEFKKVMSKKEQNALLSKKNNLKVENTYYLSKLLKEDNACIRCITHTCSYTHEKNVPFPEEICKFVKYPMNIEPLKNILINEKLIKNKTQHFRICNYVNGNCKNFMEGRKKKIYYDNNQMFFYICYYPNLTSETENITIGIHVDIKLTIFQNKKIDVNFLPYFINKENYYETKNKNQNLSQYYPYQMKLQQSFETIKPEKEKKEYIKNEDEVGIIHKEQDDDQTQELYSKNDVNQNLELNYGYQTGIIYESKKQNEDISEKLNEEEKKEIEGEQ